MAINILFYGNCQVFAILKSLNLNSAEYIIHHVECFSTNINIDEFTDIIKKCSIIITQPISENYRDTQHLSTSYLINNASPMCKIIIFDSCHFDFYYFDLTYKFIDDKILREPHDYHYNGMIDCYKNNQPVNYYIDNYVNNNELKTKEELLLMAENSLDELKTRYVSNLQKYDKPNIHVISIYEFIKQNYQKQLLFYSMNHPSLVLIHHICHTILNTLGLKNTMNYNIDCLNKYKAILYKSIQKCVDFNITNYPASIFDSSNLCDITQKYYDTYKTIEL